MSHAEAETALQYLFDKEDEAEGRSEQQSSEPRESVGE
jgi:hypothetical protein